MTTTGVLERLLRLAVQERASDIHLGSGRRPILRVDGELRPAMAEGPGEWAFDAELGALMNHAQRARWKTTGRCEFVYSIANLARFRIRMLCQHRGSGAAIRVLPHAIPRLDRLTTQQLAPTRSDNGLIVIAGGAGCGRTTTLASLLLEIGRRDRIVTIGRFVELDLSDRLENLVQIGLGETGQDYAGAIREACQADAKVITVDDAQDPSTMREALNAVHRGCLVLCGLAAANPRWAVEEIVRHDPEGSDAPRRLLADTLRAAFSQRWIGTLDGGRLLAFEVLLGTMALASHIRKSGTRFAMYSMMQTGQAMGNQTLDQDLLRLLREGRISRAEAMMHAVDPDAVAESAPGTPEIHDAARFSTKPHAAFQPEALVDPQVFARVARHREGLIVVSGSPSSGRAVTAAHVLSLVAARRRRHIVTVEDPAEEAVYEDSDEVGPVTQCVLGGASFDVADVVSFVLDQNPNASSMAFDEAALRAQLDSARSANLSAAVRAALGQDPDVLYVSVEPDAATLQILTTAADLGVLVILVLGERSAAAAVEFLAGGFDGSQWRPFRLLAAFAQRLVPRAGGGRVAVYEIMVGTPAVRNILREQRLQLLSATLESGHKVGMQTFAQHLAKLVDAGIVLAEDAELG